MSSASPLAGALTRARNRGRYIERRRFRIKGDIFADTPPPLWSSNLARCLWDGAGLTLARVVGLEWAWAELREMREKFPDTPPIPPPRPPAADSASMTPKQLATVISASALATLVQVEIYAPRKRWWHRRERILAADLAGPIGRNAAAAATVDAAVDEANEA